MIKGPRAAKMSWRAVLWQRLVYSRGGQTFFACEPNLKIIFHLGPHLSKLVQIRKIFGLFDAYWEIVCTVLFKFLFIEFYSLLFQVTKMVQGPDFGHVWYIATLLWIQIGEIKQVKQTSEKLKFNMLLK